MGLTPHLPDSSNCTHVRCHFHPDFPPENAAVFNRAQQDGNGAGPTAHDQTDTSTNQGMLTIAGTVRYLINPVLTSPNQAQSQAFSSQHTGGAHFLLGDGSVRFISENVQLTSTFVGTPWPIDSVLEALVGIADGVTVGEF